MQQAGLQTKSFISSMGIQVSLDIVEGRLVNLIDIFDVPRDSAS